MSGIRGTESGTRREQLAWVKSQPQDADASDWKICYFHHPLYSSAKGFDSDNSFILVVVAGDELHFETLSRTGEIVDTGTIERSGRTITTSYSRNGIPLALTRQPIDPGASADAQ